MNQYRSIRDAIWACGTIGYIAKLVALRLVEHWPRVFPSVTSLAQWTGLSERSVRNALGELEGKRVISIDRRQGQSSVYSFVGVSIPDLGMVDDTPAPDAGVNGPRHHVQDTPAPRAGPPRHHVPTKQTIEADKVSCLYGALAPPNDGCATECATALHRERKPKKLRQSPFVLPDDFKPGAACWQLAAEQGVIVDEELPAFCDYHRSKRSRFVDWQAAFRTWLRNAARFARSQPKSGTQATPLQRQADRIRMLREQEAEEERRKAAGGGK